MPLKSDQGRDFVGEYRTYYAGLASEELKIRFLLMLKQRRDFHRDQIAAVLLPELTERWISERSETRE